jgi:hypothetical protein
MSFEAAALAKRLDFDGDGGGLRLRGQPRGGGGVPVVVVVVVGVEPPQEPFSFPVRPEALPCGALRTYRSGVSLRYIGTICRSDTN